MKISALFLGLCLFPFASFGQQKSDYAEAIYRGCQLIGLKNMLNQTIYDDCCQTRFNGAGVITEVEYKQEGIQSFTLKLLSGQRRNVYISSTHFTNADRGWLYTLIKEGHRVRVRGCLCGNGGYWHADEMALIRQ